MIRGRKIWSATILNIWNLKSAFVLYCGIQTAKAFFIDYKKNFCILKIFSWFGSKNLACEDFKRLCFFVASRQRQRFLETAGTASMLTLTLKFKDSLKSKCWDKRHILPSHFRTRHMITSISMDNITFIVDIDLPTCQKRKKADGFHFFAAQGFRRIRIGIRWSFRTRILVNKFHIPIPNFLTFKKPRNWSQGINSASLCSLSPNCRDQESIPRNRFG
jgi:hypothetical protein